MQAYGNIFKSSHVLGGGDCFKFYLYIQWLACSYVLARKILCPRSCSLCSYVCNGLPGPAPLPKVKYSLSAVYEQAIRQNISLCEGVLVLEDHYIHTSRENKALDTEFF